MASQCCPQLPKNPSSGLFSSFAYHDTFSSKKLQPCTPAYALSNKKLKSTKKGIPNDSKKMSTMNNMTLCCRSNSCYKLRSSHSMVYLQERSASVQFLLHFVK